MQSPLHGTDFNYNLVTKICSKNNLVISSSASGFSFFLVRSLGENHSLLAWLWLSSFLELQITSDLLVLDHRMKSAHDTSKSETKNRSAKVLLANTTSRHVNLNVSPLQ